MDCDKVVKVPAQYLAGGKCSSNASGSSQKEVGMELHLADP